MGYAIVSDVAVAGVAACVPEHAVSNLDCPDEQRQMRERLVRKIGIANRRQGPPGLCFSDLAARAATQLMRELDWRAGDIDAVVVVTQSPDYLMPGTAVMMQDRLGLPQRCLAFDINLGCSGYPYGLFVVASMLAAGHLRRALLLVGDKSPSPDAPDLSMSVLFGDAGTATALEYRKGAPAMHFDLNTDGSGHQAIYCPAGGGRMPVREEHLRPYPGPDGILRRDIDTRLDGPAIFNFSIQRIPAAVTSLLAQSGVAQSEIDWFVFHQANKMINDTIRNKLRLPVERTPSTLHDFGNTSSASIPLTLTVHAAAALRQGPQRLLLSGFGIGLSWASCVLDIGPAAVPALLEWPA